MNNIYQIIMLCAIIALASCGTNTSDLKQEYKTSDLEQEYKDACNNHDYIKAYNIVSKLRDKEDEIKAEEPAFLSEGWRGWSNRSWAADKRRIRAEKYVVLHEATNVLETQGVEGLTRITFIVKEHDADWVYNDLIDIAVVMNNEELEQRLRKLAGK